jgi:hypothetical protein
MALIKRNELSPEPEADDRDANLSITCHAVSTPLAQ